MADMTQTAPGLVQLYATAPGGQLQWRLLSGNNREVGRSALDYPDEQTCRAAVLEVQHELHTLDGSVRRMPSNLWVWQLAKRDTVVATSGRDYDRMVRAQDSMDAFLRGLRNAPIAPSILVSSARRWDLHGPAAVPPVVGGTGNQLL